ncbi:MAG: 4'-phosphopantetheinyl transferase [Firmicutes bacterium ADurb.Bin419]|nr:MAG: 4'-phosphopantetheinyl transferase [Firmicutes bacterium ADurb.Bin419]
MINNSLEILSGLLGFEFCVTDMSKLGEKDLNLLSVLSEKETEHLGTLRNEKNRIQWMAGRYAVKSALFKYKMQKGVFFDLKCIDVLKGADSAPYILQYPDLCVSITHSYPYCIGLVSEKKTGIDLERINEPNDALIRHFYCEGEQRILAKMRGTERYKEQAITFWTRKEAVSKLLKLGMQMDFKKLDTSSDRLVVDNHRIILNSSVCADFCVSIAVEDVDFF